MIGQKNLISKVEELIENNKFPRSVILCGKEGSGKRTLASYVGNKLNVETYLLPDSKMESVKTLIDTLNNTNNGMLYIVPNIDEAQYKVKHTLLKILEEQPKNSYFILTCTNLDNIYDAVKSRCQIFFMELYTPEEIKEYAKEKYNLPENELLTISKVCDSFSQVDLLFSYGVQDFEKYINLVVNNISTAQISNAFKIGQKLSFKKSEQGYDLVLFLRVFQKLLFEKELNVKTLKAVEVTSKSITDLSYPSVNKAMVFDMWLIDVRKALR